MNVSDAVILLLMEGHSFGVIKDAEKMSLDSVRVRGLAQDFKKGRIRDEEESWEDQPLLLEVAGERLLTELQLLQQVREKLAQCLVPDTASDHVAILMSLVHDLHPGFVNILKPLGFLQSKQN